MKLPQKYLLPAIITKVKSLSYSVSGVNTFPRIEVYDFDTTPTGEKTNKQWVVTFLFDVISNSSDPGESLNILETLRSIFSETLVVPNFKIYIWIWEQHTEITEVTDNDSFITRQLQRVRIELEEI